jgi:transcriptional regulator with XRE-family HTH domain
MPNNTTRIGDKVNNNRIYISCFTYAQRLKIARHHKQWTQSELERYSGVKQGTISKIERGGQNFSSFDIELAYALDVDPMWLKTGREQFEPAWLKINCKRSNKNH